MLTNPGTTPDYKPTLKGNQELYEILGITELHFLRKAEILRNLKPLRKKPFGRYRLQSPGRNRKPTQHVQKG